MKINVCSQVSAVHVYACLMVCILIFIYSLGMILIIQNESKAIDFESFEIFSDTQKTISENTPTRAEDICN